MATIEEVVKWEAAIYQIATIDPVVGGPDGVANLAVRQLSNRTQYLKNIQDIYKEKTDTHLAGANPHPQYALLDSPVLVGTPKTPTPPTTAVGQEIANAAFVLRLIESVVGSAPEALDTLKELADALGEDPDFAATMTTALAGKLSKALNGGDIPDPAAFRDNIGLSPAALAGRLLSVTTVESTQNFTYDSKMRFVVVEICGGGGAGGSTPATTASQFAYGGGAQSGAYCMGLFTRDQTGNSTLITIGAGGVAGAYVTGGIQPSGGRTTFGDLMWADGGFGASSAVAPNTGTIIGGNASNNNDAYGGNIITLIGEDGSDGMCFSSPGGTLSGVSGVGGRSRMGTPPLNRTSNGIGNGYTEMRARPIGYGCGGSGALAIWNAQSAYKGGDGYPGVCRIWQYM